MTRGWGAAGTSAASSMLCCRRWRCCGSGNERDTGSTLLLWIFLVTWSTDIGAYFVGRRFGKRKLAPSISPGKTVEGLCGGIVAAALIGGAWVLAIGPRPCRCCCWRPLFAVAAQAGDLFESSMKRRAGVKDFGALAAGTWRSPRSARRPGAGGCAYRARAASGPDVRRRSQSSAPPARSANRRSTSSSARPSASRSSP